ncbi:LysR substrate-binding domain-containing protein [Pararoseomonas sp. SCSIO 73927]|uniref:LysR substrate-binding domain-containing protein n=1 Tax=Pararoseomonas sp. SCSIO 73927 TaxID=3114537 RepID=UPI0030CABF3C
MITPDWVTLRILLAAAELGSLTRAAARCGMVTSAAAKRLQQLEAACGMALLERGPRGVRPTPAGELLIRHARAAQDGLARLGDDLRALAAGGLGSVRLHATTSCIAGHGLSEALAGFARARPRIHVELQEETSLVILQNLLEGQAEIGIVTIGGAVPAGLEAHPWREDRLLAVMRDDHPLAGQAEVGFGTVLDEPLISAVESGALTLLLEEQAQRLGRRPRYRFRVAGTDACRRLVAAGHGIAVMPEGMARPYEAALGLAGVPLSDGWALRRLRLVARPADRLAQPARMLLEHLLEAEPHPGPSGKRSPPVKAAAAK